MSNESRYCLMCKKSETRDQCAYGPKIWDKVSMNENFIMEARKRDKAEAAFFATALALTAAQSPKEFVRLGHIQSPGVAYMDNMMRKRGKATVSGLDNPRVSEPARNRKIKNPPTIQSTISRVRGIKEGRVHSNSGMYPLKSGWTPNEKTRAKIESLKSKVFNKNPDARSVERYRNLLAAHEAQSQITPPTASKRHVYRLERLHGINVGRERRSGSNSQEKLMPSRFRDLPQNKNRNRFYRGDLRRKPKPIDEAIDKKTLMLMAIKNLIDEKKRKNYLLNSGYIGESKTPAWSRKAGKDLVKGGLNRKGIASYRKQHPGSKLSMAVTTDPSKLKKGSKAWNRRKNYCSRSAGQMKMWPKAAKDPNSRLRLARRKWNC